MRHAASTHAALLVIASLSAPSLLSADSIEDIVKSINAAFSAARDNATRFEGEFQAHGVCPEDSHMTDTHGIDWAGRSFSLKRIGIDRDTRPVFELTVSRKDGDDSSDDTLRRRWNSIVLVYRDGDPIEKEYKCGDGAPAGAMRLEGVPRRIYHREMNDDGSWQLDLECHWIDVYRYVEDKGGGPGRKDVGPIIIFPRSCFGGGNAHQGVIH